MRFVTRGVLMLAVVAVGVYLGLLVLLYSEQRSMLFVRGRSAAPPLPIYRVQQIVEGDGTRLTVWRADAAKAPVVVFFYGNGGTLSDFARIGGALHDEGYGIVLASYRGYSGNAGEPSEDGLMADARAVLDSLPKDHGRIVLWGQSLGTGVAARMASEGRAQAVILQSPYTSVADVAARRYPVFPVHWLMRDPFDTLSVIGKIDMPVLIMSGTADPVVPHDMARTLAARLGRHATFVPITGGGHDLQEWDMLAIADAWLRGAGKGTQAKPSHACGKCRTISAQHRSNGLAWVPFPRDASHRSPGMTVELQPAKNSRSTVSARSGSSR